MTKNPTWLGNTDDKIISAVEDFSEDQDESYTGWPRKSATTLIVNFKKIVDEMKLFFISFGRIFQQNDTMIINFG